MESLLLNRWIQIGAAALLVGIVIGVIIPFSVFSGDSGAGLAPVRPLITAGGTAIQGGEGMPGGVAGAEINLPKTATEAVAAGWKDPVLCSVGRGRYFQKGPEDEGDPYFLMFNHQDEFIGVYLYSDSEMPPPWRKLDQLLGGGGLPLIEREHWGLFVYFKDPLRACSADKGKATGARGDHYAAPHAVRSYEEVATPTPTPPPGIALEAASANIAALTTLNVSFTSEPAGLAMAEDIQPGAIGAIVTGMQEPQDTSNQWIENVPHRGIMGTVRGDVLAGLVPSADAVALATVKIWVSDAGVVRQLRIEGALAPDDPENSVRILDLGGSE